MIPKFKIGDRVVYDPRQATSYSGPSLGTVWNIDPQLLVQFDLEGIKAPRWIEYLELEEIYNSPLYQALK